jgi:hypothetical protein
LCRYALEWTAARRRHARDLRGLREAESAARSQLCKRAEKALAASAQRYAKRGADAAASLSQEGNCRRLRGRLARARATRWGAAR